MRLVNGDVESEGRVEVSVDGVWGTVCDDFWGIDDAHVVCRQLGYTAGATNSYYGWQHNFGQGTGDIWLDDVGCQGHEENIGNCFHNGIGEHNCAHFEDAGVRCNSEFRVCSLKGSHTVGHTVVYSTQGVFNTLLLHCVKVVTVYGWSLCTGGPSVQVVTVYK